MNDKELLSIVLPCYNPPTNWQIQIVQFLENIQSDIAGELELIIVNDGCTTIEEKDLSILQDSIPNFTWISYEKNKGKGYAIRQGVKAAKGNIIIYTDIDLPYTKKSFLEIYQTLYNSEYLIAVGIKDAEYYNRSPYIRKMISKLFSTMIKKVIQLSITDTQCGLKGLSYKAKTLLISGSIDRYLFDLEFIYKAEKENYSLKTIPISLREGVIFSPVRFKIIMVELWNFVKIISKPNDNS
jgi:glycosyltransferase involved in cell wall biosynthesis